MRRTPPAVVPALGALGLVALGPAVVEPALALAVTLAGAASFLWGLPHAAGLAPVPLFARLARDQLLEDGVRPRIVALLGREPGLGIKDVCARLAIGWGTAVHHLTRLEGAGLVVSQDSGRRRRFFLPSESPVRRAAVCILSTELNRRLLEHIRANPGTTQQALCAALGVSAPLAHKYLARLLDEHLITRSRRWRCVQYHAAESLAAALAEYAAVTGTPRAEGPAGPA